MRSIMTTLIIFFVILAANTAAARGYGHGHGYGYGAYAHPHGAYRHYRGGYPHFRGRGANAAYLLGGVVLGALLTPPPHSHSSPPARAPVVSSAPSTATPLAVSRRLLRDIDGNCFERKVDAKRHRVTNCFAGK